MLTDLVETMDSFVEWASTLSLENVVKTYWFLFLVEIPRYYLLEIAVLAWVFIRRGQRRKENAQARLYLKYENPLVSVLVPGKNEGRNIFKLVTSLSEQTYKNMEVIVVDDGSDDNTELICRDLEKAGYIDQYLRLVSRGGKAAASNYGARMARGKYVVSLDADSSLDRDAMERILLPFYLDREVKAVGGCIKARNYKETICSSLQALEYLKRIQVGRIVSSELGIYHIISGAFGAFERDTLEQVGYWDIGPGLDGDLTQKVRKAGYKVKFVHDAVCMTNVPTKWKMLFKQRVRWSRSLVRFRIRKHFDILLPTRNWSLANFLSNLENILFDCVLNFLWAFYIIGLVISHSSHVWEVVLLGYCIRVCLSHIAFLMVLGVSERWREDLFLYRYTVLLSPYTGYFMRMARLYAHTQELFFFKSYKDSWNPGKTSRYAQLEKI